MEGVASHVIGFVLSGAGAICAQPPLMSGMCLPSCDRFCVERGWRDLDAAAAQEWKVFSFHVIGFIFSGAGAIWAQPPFRSGRCSLPCNRFGVGWGRRVVGAAAAHEWKVVPSM